MVTEGDNEYGVVTNGCNGCGVVTDGGGVVTDGSDGRGGEINDSHIIIN